jgi:hypothetical protein
VRPRFYYYQVKSRLLWVKILTRPRNYTKHWHVKIKWTEISRNNRKLLASRILSVHNSTSTLQSWKLIMGQSVPDHRWNMEVVLHVFCKNRYIWRNTTKLSLHYYGAKRTSQKTIAVNQICIHCMGCLRRVACIETAAATSLSIAGPRASMTFYRSLLSMQGHKSVSLQSVHTTIPCGLAD